MAQKRMLHKRLLESEKIQALRGNDRARFLYTALLPFTDKLGNVLEEMRISLVKRRRINQILEVLEQTTPELLILDVHTPGIGGFDVCRMLRTMPRWQDLPIAFIGHTDSSEVRTAAYQAGADDFLAKELSEDEIQARLKVRLDRSRMTRRRADRDALTGLLSRRAFLESTLGRLSEARRQDRPFAFCLLDLDHFKRVNDTHGHIAGDRVLAALGRLLLNRFRFEDLRGRWGGEEFVVGLVNEDASTAARVLERVASEFGDINFEGRDDEHFQMTFSAGIAEFPEDGHEADRLFTTADRRLYVAKREGRARIVHED